MKELSEVMTKHHLGKLPKSYYSPKGHLYPKAVIWGESKIACERKDEKNMKEAKERAMEKIKNAPIKKETVKLKTEDLKK